MIKSDKQRIDHIIKLMQKADYGYWVLSHNFISDGEYDNMYAELKMFHKKYPNDQRITDYFSNMHSNQNDFSKKKQLYHVESLDKIRTPKSVAHFLNKWNTNPKSLWYTDSFLIEKKNDGISSVFYFNDKRMGKPLVVLTRGSGVAGADITKEARFYGRYNLAKIIKNLHGRHLVVRGELLISHQSFHKLNQQKGIHFENCRNLASGSVFDKNPRTAGKRGIFLSAYTILNKDDWNHKYPTELQQMKFLRQLGFNVIQDIHKFPNTKQGKQDILDYMFKYSHPMRLGIDHDIDGQVIKPNYTLNESKIGWNKHGEVFAKSYKFPAQQSLTQVKTIRYQISANGKLTPVIIFSHPVRIFGANISKCTGGSIGNMKKYHIFINGYITVKRMNDVIPKAYGVDAFNKSAKNLKSPKATLPKDAVLKGKFYYIPQSKMSDSLPVLVNRWSKFVSKPCLNIMGLSDKMITTLITHHLIDPHDFSSLWKMDKQKFIKTPSFALKGWNNLQAQLKQAKTTPLPQILLGLPINNAGLSIFDPVCQYISKIADKNYSTKKFKDSLFRFCVINKEYRQCIRDTLIKRIPQIKGLGKATVPVIKSLFSDSIMKQLKNLLPYLNMKDVSVEAHQPAKQTKITGLNFVITGSLSKPRKYYKNLIQSNGANLKSGVSGTTNYLICNHASSSSKYKKAQAKHIPIITEQQFRKMIK